MVSTLATSFLPIKLPLSHSYSHSTNPPSTFHFPTLRKAPISHPIKASSSNSSKFEQENRNPVVQNLRNLTKTAILLGAVASIAGYKLSVLHARAQTSPVTVSEQVVEESDLEVVTVKPTSPCLSEFLESNPEAVDSLKSLLQEKLQRGEDDAALKILERLVAAQPYEIEWKFLLARLLSEIGQTGDARKVFEEILAENPLSFEALFENALLMDRCGEGEAVIKRLQEALDVAKGENRGKEVRDVRFIIAQVQFLQKNVDEALKSYEVLSKEDPADFRPYFCRGIIYTLLDRNEEAKEQFAKYREFSPKKFEVDGYLRTSLSRVKIFGTKEDN